MCVLGVGAQVLIEYLFNMFETLGSTPSTAKKIFWLKKKKKKTMQKIITDIKTSHMI